MEKLLFTWFKNWIVTDNVDAREMTWGFNTYSSSLIDKFNLQNKGNINQVWIVRL